MLNGTAAAAIRRPACLVAAWLALTVWIGPARGAVPAVYDYVVAKDGSGDFTTVRAAVAAIEAHSPRPVTVFIKAGVYREKIVLLRSRVTLVGEDRRTTILTGDGYYGQTDGAGRLLTMPESATFTAYGKRFSAWNLTFANTSTEDVQALAIWVHGSRSRFYNCGFLGQQDTLYAEHGKQYYRNCYVEGHTDFIFGSATAVFDHCTIHSTDSGYVTAANTPAGKKFGLVFRNCTLTGGDGPASVFLGRPWGEFARTVFLKCVLGEAIDPEGWLHWSELHPDDRVFYAEYKCTGEGASTGDRAEWTRQLRREEVAEYKLGTIFEVAASAAAEEVLMQGAEPWYAE